MTESPSHFTAARTRSPGLLYAAVFASGGIFALVWLFLLMQDVNRLQRRRVFNTALFLSVYCFGLALYFASIFWPPLPGTVPPGLSPLRLGLILSVRLALLVFPAVVIVQATMRSPLLSHRDRDRQMQLYWFSSHFSCSYR